MRRAILLYNTQAGKGKIERNIAHVVNVFNSVECDITPVPIQFGRNPFDGREDVDLAVVAGGDGTVNYVVNSLMSKGLKTALAVIPAGTANDFAGAIGMSQDVVKAARQIVTGVVEQIDCGKVEHIDKEGEEALYFVNIFSFGIFTTTSQRTPEELKHRIGRMAYAVAALKELRRFHGIPLTITTDAEVFYYPTLMGLVFNGETAGRVPLARRSNLRDGLFDCLFLKKRETLFQSAVALLLHMMGIRTRALKYIKTSQLKLVTPLNEETDVDGQRGGSFPMKVSCLHGALNIVCPREGDMV